MTSAERLDARATALVVFDMQKSQFEVDDEERQRWLRESNIVANCVSLVATVRRAGAQVVFVKNNRRPDGADQPNVVTDQSLRQQGGAATAPVDVATLQRRTEIIDELKPEPADFVVDKIRTGAFSSTMLDTLLRARKIDTVIICGVRTTVGVATTVRDGRDLGYNMVVASDATGGVAPEDHQWMLDHIFPMVARVRTVDEIGRMLLD
jgi:nicotinamidase-related amidase